MRIYLPEKVIFTEAARQKCTRLLRVDKYSCLPKLKSIIALFNDFLTMNENFLLHFYWRSHVQPKDFSQAATIIKLFQFSILYFEMYINSLNVECKI